MPFTRPTLAELIDRIQKDLETRMPFSGPVLRVSVVYVFARVQAGAIHGLYGFLSYIAQQLFADTAATTYLERKASEFGITRLAATPATGTATATGTNGVVIPSGTVLRRSDGTAYVTGTDVTIAGGTATLALTALVAGAVGNADSGTVLALGSPIAGVVSNATVTSDGLVGGADQETDAGLRTRYLARVQAAPQGGSSADYVTWAMSVDGVTRAWVFPQELGPGTVTVRFVRDNDGTGTAIIPDSGEVAAVQAVVNALRPVTATPTVAAPIADAVNFTMHLANDTADAHAAVIAELTDLIARRGAPGATILLSEIRTAIGVAVSPDDFALATPNADSTHATGHLPIMGTVTFT